MTKPRHRKANWTDEFKTPKAAVKTAKRNPQLLAFTGAVGGAGALEAGKDKLPEKHQAKADTATDAIYGGAAGQAAYQLSGYGTKTANKKINDPKIYKDPKNRRGYTKPEYKKAIEDNKKVHGIKDPKMPSDWKGFQRDYPKNVPGGRVVRVLSRTHGGKSGMLIGTGATVGGAALAVNAGKKDNVKKSVDAHVADPFEISKISAKLKIVAGAKRGMFDAAGVTHPKMREKAYLGNDPVKSRLYRVARTRTRNKMEQPLKDVRDHPAVKRAAFRIVREEAGKKAKAAAHFTAPIAVGAGFGGAGVGAVAYSQKDTAEHAAKKIINKSLSQEQIDRRKKAQAITSRTTGTLGLGALGAQGVGLAVSRGKIKKLPSMKDGKLLMRTAHAKNDAAKIKSATVPLLATSAGVGSISAFNFASYTKAEAKQHKKSIPAL